MSFYQQLVSETTAERQALMHLPVIIETAQGIVTHERYQNFLTQAYHHVKHTVPLLMACGSRLQGHQHWMQAAIAEYIEEEIGHEQWILNDIAAAGGDPQRIVDSEPSYEVDVMLAYAYDAINRKNPLGFFGMVHVLEGTSTALATATAHRVQAVLGLPKQAFSYLLSHGDLDIAHVDFFQSLMNRVTDSNDQHSIISCTKYFYRLYGAVLNSVY
jgi:pyrroloquinoline quinone (PQQ) biosynthesis protein C